MAGNVFVGLPGCTQAAPDTWQRIFELSTTAPDEGVVCGELGAATPEQWRRVMRNILPCALHHVCKALENAAMEARVSSAIRVRGNDSFKKCEFQTSLVFRTE